MVELDRIRTSRNIPQPFGNQRLRQQGCGGRAITRNIIGFHCDRLHQLHAKILEWFFDINIAGNGNPVIGNRGGTERLIQHHIATTRPKRHLDHICQGIYALEDSFAGFLIESNKFCHI